MRGTYGGPPTQSDYDREAAEARGGYSHIGGIREPWAFFKVLWFIWLIAWDAITSSFRKEKRK